MNDKFTEDFIKEQLNVMEKFEKADCSLSPEYIAGRNAAIKNYVDALRKISSLEHEIRSWCRDMSAICDDGKKRVIEAERKVANLHKVIAKQQIKIQRQAENIATLLQLYTSGKRSKSHKKLREKYRALKARVSIAELEDQLEDWTNNGWAEDYKARITELEAKIDQLTAHDATERRDDKWTQEVQK